MLPPKGFILAAGRGSRLHPLTTILPKPLLPCMGVSILDIALNQLRHLVHIGINTHYLVEKFMHLPERDHRLKLFPEPSLLGTAGFLRNIEAWLEDDDLLVYNGDIVSNIDFDLLYQTHLRANAVATLALLPHPLPHARNVHVRDGRVVAIDNAATSSYHGFACAQILTASFRRCIRERNFTHVVDAWHYALSQKKIIAAYVHPGLWIDIGTPCNFFLVHRELHRHLLNDPDFLHISTLLGRSRLHLHPDHVTVGSPHIGTNCLSNTFVIGDGVTVCAKVRLDHCVVMGDTTITRDHSHKLILNNCVLEVEKQNLR